MLGGPLGLLGEPWVRKSSPQEEVWSPPPTLPSKQCRVKALGQLQTNALHSQPGQTARIHPGVFPGLEAGPAVLSRQPREQPQGRARGHLPVVLVVGLPWSLARLG